MAIRTQRPASHLNWTDGAYNKVSEPDAATHLSGWQPDQPIPAVWLNWLHFQTGQWLEYFDSSLDATVLATTLDNSMRLLGGGSISWSSSTRTLTWSQPFYLSIPGIADTNNTIPAGSLTLPAGHAAYVQANIPFTTTANTTAGSNQLVNLAYEVTIAPGQFITGAGIPSNTTVTSLSGSTVTMSQNATASATGINVTFAGSGSLAVGAMLTQNFQPSPNTVLIAKGTENNAHLGVNATSTSFRDGETKTQFGTGYIHIQTPLAGQALTARQPVYLSSGTSDGGRTAAQAYPADASQANGPQRAGCIGFVVTSVAAGQTSQVMTAGVLPGFTGLSVGAVYYLDPTSPGSLTPTRPTGVNYAVAVGIATDASTLYVRLSSMTQGPLLDPAFNSVTIAPVSNDANAVLLALTDASGGQKLLVDAGGNLTLAGAAKLLSGLTVSGASTFNNAVVVNGTLQATNGLASNTNVVAQTDITAGGKLSVTGATTLGQLSAAATTLQTLSVTGQATLQALTAAATTVASLAATNNVTVGGTLGVTGATTLAALSAAATTLASLTVSGATTLAALTASGNASVGGTLGVTGTTNVATLNASGPTATGALTVTGAATSTVSVTAPSIVSTGSAGGFKTSLTPAYTQQSASANNSLGSSNSPLNMAEVNLVAVWTQKLPYAGSLTGMSVSFRFSAAQTTSPNVQILVTKNGVTQVWAPSFNANNTSANTDFAFTATQAKGAIPFAVNDGFTLQFYTTTTFSAAATFYMKIALWVETAS